MIQTCLQEWDRLISSPPVSALPTAMEPRHTDTTLPVSELAAFPFHFFWVRRGWEPGLEQRLREVPLPTLCKDTRRMMFRLLPWDRRELRMSL